MCCVCVWLLRGLGSDWLPTGTGGDGDEAGSAVSGELLVLSASLSFCAWLWLQQTQSEEEVRAG